MGIIRGAAAAAGHRAVGGFIAAAGGDPARPCRARPTFPGPGVASTQRRTTFGMAVGPRWWILTGWPAESCSATPEPGDRFGPLGMGGKTMSLADFFRGRRVPGAGSGGERRWCVIAAELCGS